MKFEPQPHQTTAIRRLLDTPLCALFALPGSGKTATILSVLKITRARALIIAPLQTVLSSWPDELAKWDQFKNMDVATAHGKNKAEAFDHQIVLMNPEGLKWLDDNKGLLKGFDTLVIDESTKFKNWTAKRTKYLKRILPRFGRRHIMTGTPTPRSLIDWFSQQFAVDRGLSFGKYITHFRQRWFYRTGFKFYTWEPKERTPEALAELAAPHVHVVENEGLDIPDACVIDRIIKLPPDAQKQYRSMERELIAEVMGEDRVAASSGVAYGQCRQIAAGAMYDEGTRGHTVLHREKFEAAARLIEELNGAPVIVFYQYRFEADELLEEIGKKGVAEISGRVATRSRKGAIDRWNRGDLRVLLIQSQSGAHGLNLQDGGHHMIWLTVSDDPEIYEQANRRLRRLGAKHNVMIYRILVDMTVETPLITDRLLTRADRQRSLINYCKKLLDNSDE